MIVERIGNSTVIKAEDNKCLIRKGEEQKIEDNNTTIIYLAKSLTQDDFEEKDKMVESEVEEQNIVENGEYKYQYENIFITIESEARDE